MNRFLIPLAVAVAIGTMIVAAGRSDLAFVFGVVVFAAALIERDMESE
jgi:hypothetical protein